MASGTCGTNATWNLDESTGVLTIIGTGEMSNYTSSEKAPWYGNRSNIKSVIILNGITSIGDYAFYLITTNSVTIPSSVTSIGIYAFRGTRIQSITIPSSVTSIGEYAFQMCSNLRLVILEGDQPTLGRYSFGIGYVDVPVYSVVLYTTGWGSDDVFTSTIKSNYTTFIYKTLPGVYVNVNGTWKKVT